MNIKKQKAMAETPNDCAVWKHMGIVLQHRPNKASPCLDDL